VDKAAQYDDNSVRTLLNVIVNTASGDGNALRTSLDALSTRMVTVEGIANHDCGGTCPAGQRVTTQCDPATSVKTACSDCAANTYSFGGLVSSCLACDSCPSDFHEVSACTASSNRICAKCDQWSVNCSAAAYGKLAHEDWLCAVCLAPRTRLKLALATKTESARRARPVVQTNTLTLPVLLLPTPDARPVLLGK